MARPDDLIVPHGYVDGYARARKLDQRLADLYIENTWVGDPLADALVQHLSSLPREESAAVLAACLRDPDDPILNDAPTAVTDFLADLESPPEWVAASDFAPAIRLFHRDSTTALAAMVAGALVEGFASTIAKSFFITGRLRDQGLRRLQQNNKHLVELFIPGGLDTRADGWKLSVRIRVVHAQVRQLLGDVDDWDTETWGLPLHSAHMGFAITAFSARMLMHLEKLGVPVSDEERKSFMEIWRYSGHLMGIPEVMLYTTEQEALDLFKLGYVIEPAGEMESVVIASSLINAAPLLAGATQPDERRKLAKYVYRVSRALIGDEMADWLRFPPSRSAGTLLAWRFQRAYHRFVARRLPMLARQNSFTAFNGLLDISAVDESGISYLLPDHAYAEKSSWY